MKAKIGTIVLCLGMIAGCQTVRNSQNPVIRKYQKLLNAQMQRYEKPLKTDNPLVILQQPVTSWKQAQRHFRRNPFEPVQFKKRVVSKTKPRRQKPVKPQPPDSPKYELTGIIQIAKSRKALINGTLYAVGEKIGEDAVTSIENKTVTLFNGKRTITLQLKE